LDFLFLLGQGTNAPASEGGAALTGVGFMFAFPTPEHVRVNAKVLGGLVDALGLGEFDGLGFVLLIVKFSGHVSLHCGAELFVHKILPISLTALEVIECYRARFEMKFPFRDSKQFAGLMDSQSRSGQALEFAWNASFLTVSLARAQQLLAFEGDVQDFVFSMEDSKRPKPVRCWFRVKKRRAYNELFADRISRLLPVGLSLDKCLALVEKALNLGVKAA
jgi:hypothetical protein